MTKNATLPDATPDWHLVRANTGGRTAAPRTIKDWPEAPPWRRFGAERDRGDPLARVREIGEHYLIDDRIAEVVNAAIHLRRPVLITGAPGTGKSSLAYAVAWQLKLGEVLHWPVNSRATVADALYRYDAVSHLAAAQLARFAAKPLPPLERFIRLGDLGLAFCPRQADERDADGNPIRGPRVLLIDEIDKGDIDLPNDLLDLLERGEFRIHELIRYPTDAPTDALGDSAGAGGAPPQAAVDQEAPFAVLGPSGDRRFHIGHTVRCDAFPLVFLTSNGERDFPPAFLRRCLRLDLRPRQDPEDLAEVVEARLVGAEGTGDLGQWLKRLATGGGASPVASERYEALPPEIKDLIKRFLARADNRTLATDQLLNAVFLVAGPLGGTTKGYDDLINTLFANLGVGFKPGLDDDAEVDGP